MKKIILIALIAVIITGFYACSVNSKISQDPHQNMSHLEIDLFATPENPAMSPSGEYTMTIENGFDDDVYNNRFVIYSSNDNTVPIFKCEKAYRTRDRLYFLWDEKDNIWVYSGDIGTTLWSKDNNSWTELYPAQDDKPDALIRCLR